MKKFQDFIFEYYFLIEKRGGNPKYSDEHANINLYNYLVSFPEIRDLIRKKDFDSINQIITQELENSKTNPEHPLNFNNAPDEGFSGKKKTSEHQNVYYSEIERSVPGFLSLIQSKKGGNIASKGWVGRVSGGEHEQSKPSWKGNVKGQGRFDYVFSDPEDPKKQHRVSGKDYRGSQAASAQADQATATLERGVEVAAQQELKKILANRPKKKYGESDKEYRERLAKYKIDARNKKSDIISSTKETLDKIKELMASTKGMNPEGQKDVYTRVQSEIDKLEKEVPGVKRAAGQEMLRGTGQFTKGKTAQSMWTTGGEGSSFRDPRQQSVSLRARAGKGGGREMAVAGDIQASTKEKKSQKERQSTFADFSRKAVQAQQELEAQYTQTAAELEKEVDKQNKKVSKVEQEVSQASVPINPETGEAILRQYRKNVEAHMASDPTSPTATVNNQRRQSANDKLNVAISNRDTAVSNQQAHLSTPPTPVQTQPIQPAPEQKPVQTQPTQPAPVQTQPSQPAPEQQPVKSKTKQEPYKPNAIDRDGDGLVQDGTPHERPAQPTQEPKKKKNTGEKMASAYDKKVDELVKT